MPLKHKITKFHKNKYVPIPQDTEDIGKKIVHAAYLVHKALGPGLLEKYMKFACVMNFVKWD